MEFICLASAFVAIQLAQSAIFIYVVRALVRRLAAESRFLRASVDVNAYIASSRVEEPEPPEMTPEEMQEAMDARGAEF